ncbi:MAG: glutamate-5-semialdehyde dehydrogenase [Alphaproteobacteria bacterium]
MIEIPQEKNTDDITQMMDKLGWRAREAANVLAQVSSQKKEQALQYAAQALRRRAPKVLAANRLDLDAARKAGDSTASLDRLMLDSGRIADMATNLEMIAALPDPVGAVVAEWTQPNGLIIQRVRTPLGVVGVIYESRPNVTADAAALCFKAGNAVILRGGSDSWQTSSVIAEALVEGLREVALPEDAIQLVPTRDRAAVGAMLGMQKFIDVIIPRGGKSLVERVMTEAKVPVFAHLEGLCHTYIHAAADFEKARRITVNAKMRRPGVCGATETLLIDEHIASRLLPLLAADLLKAGCELRGDDKARHLVSQMKIATEADWSTEYLDAILSVKIVAGIDEAMAHIAHYGSHHTDAIITEDTKVAERFLSEVDSAIVLHNTSTQFADGGEFGFGAEVGIATGRLHARGPVGVEQLTTFKYKVRGAGQIRD